MPIYVKKYELTQQKMTIKKGLTLYRIKALRDFACVRKGDLGGWVESERNLATDYNLAWVSGNARVYGAARVEGDAWVSENSQVYGQALVNEDASVEGNARVYGHSMISDCANLGENARVFGEARVIGNAKILGEAQICEEAMISGYAVIRDNAKAYGNAKVYGEVQVFGNAEICGEATIRNKTYIGGDAKIENAFDCISISPIGEYGSTLTFTRCGMVFGKYIGASWDELLTECKKKDMPKQYRDQYRSTVRFAEKFFKE